MGDKKDQKPESEDGITSNETVKLATLNKCCTELSDNSEMIVCVAVTQMAE